MSDQMIIAERWLVGESMQLVVHRTSGFDRLRGMIGRAPFDPTTAMLFTRCNSVHGFGMRRSLDVVFIDRDLIVTSTRQLRPWRVVTDRRAVAALELEAGEIARLCLCEGVRLNNSRYRGVNISRSDP